MIIQQKRTFSGTLHRLRGFLGDCSGSVASEFALLLPLTALMLSGLVEFGMALNDGTSLENGARAGAQFALNQGLNSPGILAVVANASNLDPETLTVTSREFWECSGSWGVEVISSTNCGTNIPLAKFIEVRVVHQYSAMFPYLDAMAPDQMESSATLRVP